MVHDIWEIKSEKWGGVLVFGYQICVCTKCIMEALYSGHSALYCLSSVRAFQHGCEDLVWGCTDVNVSVLMAAPAAHLSPVSINMSVAMPAALKLTAAASNSLP